MKRSTTFVLAAIFSAALLNTQAKEMKPWMLEKGAVVFAEDFSGALDPQVWSSAKGTWVVENGALKGVERADDHHAAAIRRAASMRHVIIQFDFRFDGSPGFSLSMNHDGGHNSRIVFTPDSFAMRKDLNKKDPADFSAILGECTCTFEPGKWYTMLVEYHGKEMLARIDDQAFILGAHSYIDQERTSIGFPVLGDSASFDHVKVWEGTLRSDWNARRIKLAQTQAKRPGIEHKNPKDAWRAGESKLRMELMENDPSFRAMVQKRAAIDANLKAAYPKAFRTNAKGAAEKAALMNTDPAFKQLMRDLNLARKAEREYMHKKDPGLTGLYVRMQTSRKPKK
ncbi:hypothetical protein [Pontiella sulfatireligans]|uniref:3-keto-disaccharide hydrolase domain-containing protein n=1 Tax=Pontiella sulfatireligans TaxID=2750658 RepID=A0A6C2USP0_9BACT|nr:hypothetical protein [Pontiella sulfatireligans]VGO23335.1 hypothetical protein SCARR_05442 [Pontiella sulfatireligans]